MNFHISKTLLFKINKYTVNCTMISEKKIRVLMIRHKFSTSPILLINNYFGLLFGSVFFCFCFWFFFFLRLCQIKVTHSSKIFVSPLLCSVVAWTHMLKLINSHCCRFCFCKVGPFCIALK